MKVNKVEMAVLALIVGVLVVVARFAYQEATSSKEVVATKTVGPAIGATHHPSTFGVSTTSIETTKGTYIVGGNFQVFKQHELVLETRGNGDQLLCDHSQQKCAKLNQ